MVSKLRGELEAKDEEVHHLRTELQSLQQYEADLSSTLDKVAKMIVNEIDDECKRTALLLGVTPRKSKSGGYTITM